jgi:ankyrin repeat protein
LHRLVRKNVISANSAIGHGLLSLAAKSGHEFMVQFLLHAGKADIDAVDLCGVRPLTWAARCGSIVDLLLHRGAKIDGS